MDIIGMLLTASGAAAGSAALSTLALRLFSDNWKHFLDTRLESVKTQQAAKIEELKTELRAGAYRNEVRFSAIYALQVASLNDLYVKMVRAEVALRSYVRGDSHTPEEHESGRTHSTRFGGRLRRRTCRLMVASSARL
jgi:hypothetical protein